MAVEVGVHQLLNTLYVMTQGAYVHVDHETLKVEVEKATALQVPVHHLGGLVCFGNVLVSPHAIAQCAEEGRSVVFLSQTGRFRARVVGPASGNVLLRRAQHQALDSPAKTLEIARSIVAAKVQNTRQVLLRGARQAKDSQSQSALRTQGDNLAGVVESLPRVGDLDTLRGKEGEAALGYFGVFGHLVLEDPQTFKFDGRNRRPPRDPMNAVLSFVYALVTGDCVAALEGVGLDPQVGYLHALRPGRPALALDLVEELRAPVAERLALTLVNRRQVTKDDFEQRPGGAVSLTERGRKEVVVAYQKRKAEEVRHEVLDRSIPLGLVPHVQARLLARHLRGDLEAYLPYVAQ